MSGRILVNYTCNEVFDVFVGYHPIFSETRGFQTSDDLSFYTDEMHLRVLEMHNLLLDGDRMSPSNKIETIVQILSIERKDPIPGTQYRSVFYLKI